MGTAASGFAYSVIYSNNAADCYGYADGYGTFHSYRDGDTFRYRNAHLAATYPDRYRYTVAYRYRGAVLDLYSYFRTLDGYADANARL